ncbi:MAG: polar amino acid ABC transporter permease [Candidatus Epulonipiscium fishelsonii]|nr:MAG: polar amino acid ABC transporter permease [Epulopiscium sp. AS2M-Bin002]
MNISTMIQQLSEGMVISIQIFFATLLFSIPLGAIICYGRLSKNKFIRKFTSLYISLMRGTPLVLQLLVVYFGPYYLFGISISPGYKMIAVIIGFSINYAAYFAEIYRGGILSIDEKLYEAAMVFGYSRRHTFFIIILPLLIKRILPATTNEIITLVKDTTLAFVLAVAEVFTIAKQIASSQTTMLPFIIAGIFYFVFNYIVQYIMECLEKNLCDYE